MSVSVSDELQLFAQEIQSFLSPNTLRDLARDVGFVKRTSKYQAKDLVALCIWVSQNVARTSLTQLSSCLEASTAVLISPEGLNQRFNKGGRPTFTTPTSRTTKQKIDRIYADFFSIHFCFQAYSYFRFNCISTPGCLFICLSRCRRMEPYSGGENSA
ncbi:Uncharacterized protein BC10311_00690 [Bacillus wiedmannii]|uniref:IS4 family transposase n=1 Tax=Bacillus wiedmannii TaxID=1890302 RepID=A0AB37YLS1_9BACI|nr:Uncharacterized protein BC10311_00690 [Bacillus wiedmannii]